MKTLLTFIWAWISSLNPMFAALVTIGVTMISVFNWVNTKMHAMIAQVDALAVTNFSGTLNIHPLGLLDTFIPLTETLTFLSGWLSLLAVCSAIRIVKSFVPAVAT